MDRETRTYTPPTREIIYRPGWLRADATGLTPINVRTMYVGMVDAWNGDFEVRILSKMDRGVSLSLCLM